MDDPTVTSMVSVRSIPNVPTGRLVRSLDVLHATAHTIDGMHAHDAPRRTLIETAARAQMIAHELRLRGVQVACARCASAPPQTTKELS